jgi:hypothetical protein
VAADITRRWDAAAALLEADMHREHTVEAAIIRGLEWDPMPPDITAVTLPVTALPLVIGTGLIGVAEIGTAAIGVVTTIGTAAVAIGKTRTENGVGGTGTDGVIPITMSCSLATLAFPGGGAGAGARGQVGAGDTAITAMATHITVATAILTTVMGMATGTVTRTVMATEMDTAPNTNLAMAIAANPELPSYSGDCREPAITADPLTGYLGHKRGAQFERTSRLTVT